MDICPEGQLEPIGKRNCRRFADRTRRALALCDSGRRRESVCSESNRSWGGVGTALDAALRQVCVTNRAHFDECVTLILLSNVLLEPSQE